MADCPSQSESTGDMCTGMHLKSACSRLTRMKRQGGYDNVHDRRLHSAACQPGCTRDGERIFLRVIGRSYQCGGVSTRRRAYCAMAPHDRFAGIGHERNSRSLLPRQRGSHARSRRLKERSTAVLSRGRDQFHSCHGPPTANTLRRRTGAMRRAPSSAPTRPPSGARVPLP